MPTWKDKIHSSFNARETPSQNPTMPFVVMLVEGEDRRGLPQWAYAQIPLKNYDAFKEAEKQGNYDLNDFGKILESGSGKAPPEDIRLYMKEHYGCDENFEATLMQITQEALALAEETEDPKH